jgi:hypothetical protein
MLTHFQPSDKKQPKKLFCHVMKFAEEDADAVKLPKWMLDYLDI